MGKLDNKVAVVSGAARGQGRSHAIELAAEGANVIVFDICADLEGNTYPLSRPEDLDETALLVEKEGVRCFTAICRRARARRGVADDRRGVEEMGRLDIVVANAGICPMGKGQTLQSWSDTIDTDLVGVFNVIQASMPHLNDGASVIATGSLAAQLGSASNQGPGGSAYSLAKQIVAHYVNDLSIQLAKRMIRVNARAPDQRQHRHAAQRGHVPGVPARPGLADPRRRREVLPGDAGDAGALYRTAGRVGRGGVPGQRRLALSSPAPNCASTQADSSRPSPTRAEPHRLSE